MGLKDRLRAEIAEGGPISVADYMRRCLHDPLGGYYAMNPALGEEGDFITAPLVSQMFGELVGLWAAECWVRLGRPARVLLVEVGPGDGTLMSDMLRATRLVPDFLAAAELWLVETSEPLRRLQAERLSGGPLEPHWAGLEGVPAGAPIVAVANELLDCLPVRQFLRQDGGWAERVIGLAPDGELAWGLRSAARPPGAPVDLPPALVWETAEAHGALGAEAGARLVREGGYGLFLDYGRAAPEPGDTLQALRRHRKVDPLACPGEADLTAWADFPSFEAGARGAGARTALLAQGEFLRRLGIDQRAAALAAARPDRADLIARQRARLVEPDQMGELFKACAVWTPDLPAPPAFEESA